VEGAQGWKLAVPEAGKLPVNSVYGSYCFFVDIDVENCLSLGVPAAKSVRHHFTYLVSKPFDA
jgi:hypothetical protein